MFHKTFKMTKTKFVTVTTPDGTVLKRRTAREYSHAIVREKKGKLNVTIRAYGDQPSKTIKVNRWTSETWIGRPDLVAARIRSEFGITGFTKSGLIKENDDCSYYLIETDK